MKLLLISQVSGDSRGLRPADDGIYPPGGRDAGPYDGHGRDFCAGGDAIGNNVLLGRGSGDNLVCEAPIRRKRRYKLNSKHQKNVNIYHIKE